MKPFPAAQWSRANKTARNGQEHYKHEEHGAQVENQEIRLKVHFLEFLVCLFVAGGINRQCEDFITRHDVKSRNSD